MIAIAIKDVQAVIGLLAEELEGQRAALQEALKVARGNLKLAKHLEYLDFVAGLDGEMITAIPIRLQEITDELDVILPHGDFKLAEHQVLKDELVAAFGYKALRSNFYPEYFHHIGIKACVYCNAQLAVAVVEGDDGKYRAKFQVDHYWAKTDFPVFSTALFNLYPVCASCNVLKSTGKVKFELYVETPVYPSDFQFYIDPDSVIQFLDDRQLDSIVLDFLEPPAPADHKSFNELFRIKGVYDTQKDIAEELILKMETYTADYKQSLITQFPGIFNEANIDRLITGNYMLERQTHQRPLAKFMRDLSLQLGLVVPTEESNL